MRVLAIILLVCFVGCKDRSATSQVDHNAVNQNKEVAVVETATVNGVVLNPITVAEGKLSLLIPDGFSLMSEEMLRIKYPSERRPTNVYTNERGTVNIAVNHTNNNMQISDLTAAHKHFDSTFRNLYPSAKWFESKVISLNDWKWFSLNLRTPAIDTEIRNIMVGTSVEGRLLMVSVNITKELEEEWLEPAMAIIKSLRIQG